MHLGDHDPSGIDMSRDNEDRLAMFARSSRIVFLRLALNMDQIEEHGPPANPAKATDARFTSYVDRYGEDCWELDALDPTVIDNLIRSQIEPLIDFERWDAVLAEESETKRVLAAVGSRWSDVSEMIDRPDYS